MLQQSNSASQIACSSSTCKTALGRLQNVRVTDYCHLNITTHAILTFQTSNQNQINNNDNQNDPT